MNTQRTHVLRQFIEEGRRALADAQSAVVIPHCADDNELASCYENLSVIIIGMQRTGQRLRHLAQSMAVIESQPRGLCIDCGEEIPSRRLTVQPEAVRCAPCQEEWEEERIPGKFGYGSAGRRFDLCHA